jgi:hypothetical protein
MTEKEIVTVITKEFRTFGGGTTPSGFNPIEQWLQDAPPQFAMGVDVAAVVRRVIELSGTTGRRRRAA